MSTDAITIPKGYKQTDIGVIPDDWNVLELGQVLKIKHGKSQKKVESIDGKFPILATGGEIGRTNEYLYNKPSVLIGRKGTIDSPSYFDTPFWTVDTLFYSEIKEENDPRFLYYKFLLIDWYLYNEASGVPSLSGKTIERIQQSFPRTKSEQSFIANILLDVDTLIGKLEGIIEKKKNIKQGVMQRLLQPYNKDGEIKEDWKFVSLFELADSKKELFDDGDWIESEHISDKGIRLIQTGNIGVGEYVEKDFKKYIFEESFERLNCKRLLEGDLLICRLADPAGRACVLPNIGEEKIITSVDVTIFRPRKEIANRYFLASLFSTDEWFKKVNESVGGTTHKRISKGFLGKIKIALPKIEEQNESARILLDVNTEIEKFELELTKYKDIKQGMMQTLLTGKIRLIK